MVALGEPGTVDRPDLVADLGQIVRTAGERPFVMCPDTF
jgi:hypothetical protein